MAQVAPAAGSCKILVMADPDPSDSSGPAVLFGASGGIGRALVTQLAADPRYSEIYAGSRTDAEQWPDGVMPFQFDLTDEASVAAVAARLEAPPTLVIVATGLLHDAASAIAPEKTLRRIKVDAMARLFAVNTIGPALVAKHFLPLMPRDRRSAFAALSARVGSISDNRLGGWHGYRASKAALNMLLRNFSIEMAYTHPKAIVVGLHPGTVDSRLSAPFQRGVPAGKLLSPAQSAGCLLSVLDTLTPADSGHVFAWDGSRVPE